MKVAAWIVFFSLLFTAPPTVADVSRDADIEAVIEKQLSAFNADDFDAAFAFATPGIQQRFGSVRRFALMVVHRYPMVWRSKDTTYIGLENLGTYSIQKVMITDHQNAIHLLMYQMVRINGQWRIGAVQLVPLSRYGT